MAVPFGFSAGDFMAAIHLVHKITTALRETDGASSEFSQTICQLHGLDGLLRSVQSAHSANVDPQQLDRLQILGRECYIPLNRFFSKIKALEPALGSSFATNHNFIDKAKRATRKVQWGLRVKKELSQLTIAMGPRISAINTQLLLINLERERKAGSSLDTLMQELNDLNSQIGNLERNLDIRIDSLATMTSMENVSQALQDIRLEATNHHNSQIDTIREQIIQTGSINTKVSQQMLDSIQLLTSKIQIHDDCLRKDATQSTTSSNPGLESYPVDDSGSPCHAQGGIQRAEDQLAAQTKLLQLLTEKDLTRQSSSSLLKENSDVTLQEVKEAIQKSIQVLFSFFRGCADTLLLKLWIILPVVQHVIRNLQAPRLIASLTMGENITFEDVLGRVVRLPYQHFRHYPVFIARLQCEFKGIPGENQVLLNQFRIFKQERYTDFLTNDNWEVTVRPGSRIAMSVLLARRDSEGSSCPRCKTNKASETTEGLLRCTACGLSWALQKFDTSNTSSGGPRIEGFASDLLPVPNTSDTEEVVPSIPSTSLSDLSDVPSSLADEKDIKSFRMVHIEERTPSIHADETSSITSSLKSYGFSLHEPFPWEHSSFGSLTVKSVLTERVQRGPSYMLYGSPKPHDESLYIFPCKGTSNILRIGSASDVKDQFNEWTHKCGPIYEYDPKLYEEGTTMKVPWAVHVLQLVHAELMDYQLTVNCEKCLLIHYGIFHVSKNHAMRVIQKWRKWALKDPYMWNADGEWELKPLFKAQVADTCQPLPIRN